MEWETGIEEPGLKSITSTQFPTMKALKLLQRVDTDSATRRCVLLGLTAALGCSAVAAEDPLPAGFERMLDPKAPHVATFGYSWDKSVFQSPSGVSINTGTKKTRRVLDLEWGGVDRLDLVEVANTGLLGAENWLMAFGVNQETMFDLLDNGIVQFPEVPVELRLDDVEFTYRKNPLTGAPEVAYAFTAVNNSGKHFADWEFVPPLHVGALDVMIEIWQLTQKRPWDIEFAKDPNGNIMFVALVTSDETSGLPVPWMIRKDLMPWEVAGLNAQNWVLTDMELDPETFPAKFDEPVAKGGIGNNSPFKINWPPYFAIFVNPTIAFNALNGSHLGDPVQAAFFQQNLKDNNSRLFDIEYAGQFIPPSAGKDKSGINQAPSTPSAYASVHLKEP